MDKDTGVGRRSSIIAGLGLSLSFVLGIACGDDEGSETMAGSADETTVSQPDSTGPDSSSSADISTSSSSSGGSTMAVDSTSTGSSSEETAIPEVLFPEVLVVIQDRCFCHRGAMPSGMLALDDDVAYESLVDVPAPQAPGVSYVTAGDLDNSYLYLKLTGEQATVGGIGTSMPQGGTLTDEQLAIVRHWILSGAQP